MILGEAAAVIIFILGCYIVMARRDIVKTTIGLGFMSAGIVLYFLTTGSGYLVAPIGEKDGLIADPLPQALMITNIIIGMASTGVALGIFLRIYKKYDSARWDTIHRKQEEEI